MVTRYWIAIPHGRLVPSFDGEITERELVKWPVHSFLTLLKWLYHSSETQHKININHLNHPKLLGFAPTHCRPNRLQRGHIVFFFYRYTYSPSSSMLEGAGPALLFFHCFFPHCISMISPFNPIKSPLDSHSIGSCKNQRQITMNPIKSSAKSPANNPRQALSNQHEQPP